MDEQVSLTMSDLKADRADTNAALAEGRLHSEIEEDTEPEAVETNSLSFAAIVEAQGLNENSLEPEAEATDGPDETDEAPGMSPEVLDRVLNKYVADSRSPRPRPAAKVEEPEEVEEVAADGGRRGPASMAPRDAATIFNRIVQSGITANRPRSLEQARRRRGRPTQIGNRPTPTN